MRSTSAAEIVAVAFAALAPPEREEAFARVNDIRLERLAGEESATAFFIRSLRRVAEVGGGELTPDIYRRIRRALVGDGEEVAELNAVIRHFGSWRRAKEALGLSEVSASIKIDARFRGRQLGKVHRYREESLGESLERCVRDLGHVPLVIEYERWRRRELDLANVRGEELHLPSDSPYRRRWGSWENALLHFGFSPDAIAERLEPGRDRSNQSLSRFQFAR